MMECPLKRDLDFKLVFDVLTDANGLVRLSTLQESWPGDPGNLPRSCLRLWGELATQDGYLDWEAFSTGVERALKDDRFRLGKPGSSSPSKAEQTLQSLQGGRRALQLVSSAEMELYLSNCEQRLLVQALARTRKEVYNCQRSLHAATTAPSQRSSMTPVHWQLSPIAAGTADTAVELREPRTKGGGEEEEVMRGLELLQRAERWYRRRLNYLSLQEQTNKRISQPENAQAEGLLAALEADRMAQDNERHIQGINAHLRALMAVEQPMERAVAATAQRMATPDCPTHRQSLYDLLSAGNLQRRARTPHRSLSVTPADHAYGRDRKMVKRSLSLKGTLADYQDNSSQQYSLRAAASVREFTYSQQEVTKATGLPAPMKEAGARLYPPARPQQTTPTSSVAHLEAGRSDESTRKSKQVAPVARRQGHRRPPHVAAV